MRHNFTFPHVSTIQRRCIELGLRRHRAVEELTKRHKQRLVEWCRQHRATIFENFLFSDESSFELAALSIPRRQMVYRTIREKYFKCCIVTGGLRNRQSIMAWGVISASGPACFALLDANVNAHSYWDARYTPTISWWNPIGSCGEHCVSAGLCTCSSRSHHSWFSRPQCCNHFVASSQSRYQPYWVGMGGNEAAHRSASSIFAACFAPCNTDCVEAYRDGRLLRKALRGAA